jgi:hypothetical protein
VYLTGSHIWSNLHDGMGPGRGCAETPQAAGGDFHLCMTPRPWPRTGPGAASDGRPAPDQVEGHPFRAANNVNGVGIGSILDSQVLVLQPAAGPFTVTLAAGTYTVKGFGVDSRQTVEAGQVTVEDDERFGFTPPFAEPEPAVLYVASTG